MTGANFLNLLHSIYLTANSSVSAAHRTHIPSSMQITPTEHLQIHTITTQGYTHTHTHTHTPTHTPPPHTHIHIYIYIYIYTYIYIRTYII